MLAIEDVVTTYGAVRALDGVSVTVDTGTIVAVLGANGAGKTTLLRTVNRLAPMRSGRITFDGKDLGRTRVEDIVRLGLAHVPEGRGVITELTVEENLLLGSLWRGKRSEAQGSLEQMYWLF